LSFPANMSEWITDRVPTEADADDDGEVIISWTPGDTPEESCKRAKYSAVSPGQPWWSERADYARDYAARQVGPPAPAPTRVVTAMCAAFDNMYAACNDGTLWARAPMRAWEQLPSIPQPEAPDA
jgi:hypothetical protein